MLKVSSTQSEVTKHVGWLLRRSLRLPWSGCRIWLRCWFHVRVDRRIVHFIDYRWCKLLLKQNEKVVDKANHAFPPFFCINVG